MKNLTTILLLLGSMFMLSNCKDDCADKKTPLKDLHLNVPYSGTETLRFLHNSTDTQFFIGQGMERFYVTEAQKDDYDCPEDHESVRIRFINPKTLDEIKMEYVFDQSNYSSDYKYKFYYKNSFMGNRLENLLLTTEINGVLYNNIGVYSNTIDTINYFLYRFPTPNGQYSGILKIKQPNDTLTIVR